MESWYSYHWVPDYYHSTCCVVHGWGGCAGSMRQLIEAMLASNILVVAVDVAAHGASSGHLSNLAIYRDCVAEIWNHYEQIDSFVGHSIGGTTVALLCSQLTHHPNIDRLKSIVMMSSPNSIEAMARRFLARINADPVSEPHFLEQIEKVAELPMNRLTIQHFLETVPAQHVAVIHDKFDEVIPYQEALDIKQSCDRVVLETTENLAHNRIYRDKDVISKTVRFISESALA